MADIELIAQKRAFPSRGRARIHSDTLTALGIGEGTAVEISPVGVEHWITVSVFADSLVERGAVRLSEEDLGALGSGEGTRLRVRTKGPITSQIKASARDAASAVSSGLGKAGESLKGASADSVTKGAKEAAAGIEAGFGRAGESMSESAGSIARSAKGTAADAGARLGKAGESIGAIFAQAVEQAKKKLRPADAQVLDKTLKANEGEVRAVTVPAGIAVRPLSAVSLPRGVVLAAVQRGDAIQTTEPTFLLVSGDIVYLVGESRLLDEAARVIGG
ncbi:MAG: TrkA C-terminal domain-containing protein [Methanoregulaceae archaeon]|nr:TrkA C-terminal domain-containing protein [Methanoregulaceae archaeon]